jgi:hypothetical protein
MPDNNIYIGQALFIGWVLYDATSGSKGIVAEVERPVIQGGATQKKNNVPKQGSAQKPDPEAQWPSKQKEMHSGPTIVPDAPVYNTHVQAAQQAQLQPQAIKKHDTVFAYRRNLDTVKAPPMEALFLAQTGNGTNITEEKGSIAFFNAKSAPTVYYALHNDIARGVIIRIHNPGNDKMIYAKVIGPLPANKQYYNCVMALSANAKEELGVKEDKIWCEVSFRQNQ